MTTPTGPRDLLARLPELDLSALLALRALLGPDAGGEWVTLAELTALVEREHEHLSARPDGPVHSANRPWSALEAQSTLRDYLGEQVVARLARDGLLELRPETGELAPESDGQALRLAAADGEGPPAEALLRAVDERIAEVGAQTHAGPATSADFEEPRPWEPETEPGERITLSARGLVKVYRKRRVVNDVDLHVSQGEIVGLLGPNGAGKTTTFYMMVGLIPPDQGKVHLDGQNVTSVPMYRRARRGVGYLSQEPSVFRRLTVEENILAILQMLRLPKREQKERLEGLLDELGIKHLRKSKAYSLSGGERRRLEITRALVGRPKFMLLDEPFAGVDPIAVHDIQQIVADLRRRSIGVLISDHNVEQTLDIVDRAYIMYDGRVRVSGTVSELVWNDEVAEIYLGPTLTARMRQRYPRPTSAQVT